MSLLPVLLLLQQPAPARIARVEVLPAAPAVRVGERLQLEARALDAEGRPVDGARITWLDDGGGEGAVDSTGMVTGGYRGSVRVTAVASLPGGRPVLGRVRVAVRAAPAARVVVSPAVGRVLAGTRLTLRAKAFTAQEDPVTDPVTFTSSDARVASVTPDGRLTAVTPGRATITAAAGAATATLAVQVVGGTVGRFALAPAATAVRTGDVVRFRAEGRLTSNEDVAGLPVRWALEGGAGVAQLGDDGTFVAEAPGRYTVTAALGGRTADATVTVAPRAVGRGLEVVGRLPIAFQAAEVWVHPAGTCAYLTTIADRVYAVDIRDPSAPRIVDSMVTDARLVNDVMTTEDGAWGVFSRENASTRKNGIVIFDARDPCHPKPVSEYTETVSGGVHSTFVWRNRVYLTDDATGSLRIIDIIDPTRPREVGRWQAEQTEAGRYLHDVAIHDGLAYLSYWNDGLIILDVGHGIRGGTPDRPVFVAQAKYDLEALYARVGEQFGGLAARGTHTAWRQGRYVFVGDEVYAAEPAKGLADGNDLTWGRLHVFDVSDITAPRLVAWYEPTDGGVHNLWAAGDSLYIGNYQGGVRVLDISGELRGDLLRQGREMAWLFTADDRGVKPRATFTWGVVVRDGLMYVPDINTGLWIVRMEPRPAAAVP